MPVVDTSAVPRPVLPAATGQLPGELSRTPAPSALLLPAPTPAPPATPTAPDDPVRTSPTTPVAAPAPAPAPCATPAAAPTAPERTRRQFLTVASAILLLAAFSALLGTGLDMWSAHRVRSWIPAGAGYSNSFGPGWDGSLNRLSYFTAQSNLLVAVSSLLLVVRPRPRGRVLPFLQVVALLDISITCIVYVTVLAGPNIGGDFPTEVIIATTLQHLVTPLLAWAAWLLAGPATASLRGIALASLVPLAYCLLTLVRGALVDWYPYPFLDVPALGYARVLAAVGCVALLVPVVGLLMLACQRFLRPRPRDTMTETSPDVR